MKTAVKMLVTGLLFGTWLCGCSRNRAEAILLQQEQSEEETANEETKKETDTEPPTASSEEEAAVPMIIEVTCSCQCQGNVPDDTIEASDPAVMTPAPAEEDGRININTADAAQLQLLNGIGQARAQAIISYREQYGNFGSIEDIKNVSGIGDGIFSRIKDDICV